MNEHGILAVMDIRYQRGKIQEESLYCEHNKHHGLLPLMGVNTFLQKDYAGEVVTEFELIRLTEEEKGQQIVNVQGWQASRNPMAPGDETEHGHRHGDGVTAIVSIIHDDCR